MKPHIVILISFDLFMFADGSFKLKLKVSVLNHELVTLSVKFVQFARVIFLSFLKLLKFLLEPDFHFGSILSVLIKKVLQMFDYVFFRQVIDGICLVHIKCVGAVQDCVLSSRNIETGCHHELIFGDGVLATVLFKKSLKTVCDFLLDLVACKLNIQ